MLEPDVTLTDYALAAECGVLALLLVRTTASSRGIRDAGIGFFACLGLSAATGGTVHGFCPDKQSAGCLVLWQATLQLVGLASASLWMVGAAMLSAGRKRRGLIVAAVPQFTTFSALALLTTQQFWLAFTIYLPALVIVFVAFVRAAPKRGGAWWMGALGAVLSLASCLVQFFGVGIPALHFSHNAAAHLVQCAALVLLFVGIRRAAK
jgi:hypothetical protein